MPIFRRLQGTARTSLHVSSVLGFVLFLGLLLILAGAVADTGYHLWWSSESRFAVVGLTGHLVTLAGMVLTLVGVLAVGLRHPNPSACPKGELRAAGRRASTS